MPYIRFRVFSERSGRVFYNVFVPVSYLSLPTIFIASMNQSNLLIDSTDVNQCLTTSKIISTVLVTVGILIFTAGKQRIASTILSTQEDTEN